MNNEQYTYTVCIHCMTYNHKPYILDALHGFTMQQTKFPYVALVMDDASTDGEPEVLRQYIAEQCDTSSMTTKDDELYELIEINAKDNPNCHFAFYFLKQNLYGTGRKKPIIDEWDVKVKYIACCEGDDYWTDPLKLQKQVDYLETHDECVMCCHAAEWDCNGEKNLWGCQYDHECDLTTDEVIRFGGLYIVYASTIYRKELLTHKAECIWWQMADVGDYPLHIAGTLYGTFHFFPDVMSVYRYQHEGSWTSQKNHQTTMKHTQCEINWLEEFDKDTDYKYTNAIHYHLWRYYSALYKHNLISLPAYLRSISHSDAKKSVMYKRAIKDIIKRFLNKLK